MVQVMQQCDCEYFTHANSIAPSNAKENFDI